MKIKAFYDHRTNTVSYVTYDEGTRDAVIIDPVLDYEPAASMLWTESVDEILEFVRDNELTVHFVIETHAHADHLSGSQRLKDAIPNAQIAVGAQITQVQGIFKSVFGLPDEFAVDGSQFDRLLNDDEVIDAGSLKIHVINTPGHTPACITLHVGDAIFTGDAIFMPDGGTGRCDFPGGSASELYSSIRRLYELPDETRVFVGHDYQPNGRELRYETTIAEQKASNIHLRSETTESEFTTLRNTRDATLNPPKLLFQSIQVNVDAGSLPEADAAERRYLRIPVNVFKAEAPAPELAKV